MDRKNMGHGNGWMYLFVDGEIGIQWEAVSIESDLSFKVSGLIKIRSNFFLNGES